MRDATSSWTTSALPRSKRNTRSRRDGARRVVFAIVPWRQVGVCMFFAPRSSWSKAADKSGGVFVSVGVLVFAVEASRTTCIRAQCTGVLPCSQGAAGLSPLPFSDSAPESPAFRDGVISVAVDEAVESSSLYFSSAGNDGLGYRFTSVSAILSGVKAGWPIARPGRSLFVSLHGMVRSNCP